MTQERSNRADELPSSRMAQTPLCGRQRPARSERGLSEAGSTGGTAAAQEARSLFAGTLLRVAAPGREVTWADFLLADVLTSLAKPLADASRAACHLLTGPVMALRPGVRRGAAPTKSCTQ